MSIICQDPLLRLRPMLEGDLDDVMRVEQAAYEYPWTLGVLHDCILAGYSCWVWCRDHELLGHGVMMVAAGECHLLNLCVHPDWRGQGLGRRLLMHLLNIARGRHADTAFLEVRASNNIALQMYQSAGFNEVGIRRGYYPHRRGSEDALVLAKDLGGLMTLEEALPLKL